MKSILVPILLYFTICDAEKEYIKYTGDWSRSSLGSCELSSWILRGGKWKTCLPSNDATVENCTLMTGVWPLNRVNKILIEIETTTRMCFPKPYPTCRDNMTLNIYSDADDFLAQPYTVPNTNVMPHNGSFTKLDKFEVNGVTLRTGIKLGFLTNRYCGAIDRVSVFYYKCPTATGDLVNFEESTAPDSVEQRKTIYGVCTENAELLSTGRPFMYCTEDGSFTVHGSCTCKKGYTKHATQCRACPAGEYKPGPGIQVCSKCGANSKQGIVPRTKCACQDGFFKAVGQKNNNTADCYAPPSEPTNVVINGLTAHKVTLTWAPSEPGSSNTGYYVINCEYRHCPDDSTYFPKNSTMANIELKDLGAYGTYKITITKINNITSITGQTFPAKKTFQTLPGAPGNIRNPAHRVETDGSVLFFWDAPFAQGADNPRYVVSYGDENFKTTTRTFKIKSGTQDKEYTVKINTEVTVDGKVFSGPVYQTTIKVKGGISLQLTLGLVFGLITLIVLILVSAFCFWKRRNPAYLQVVRMEDGTVKLPSRFYTGGKIYVDPKSYPDVEEAVNEFAFEIDRQNLNIQEKIGDGEFADVHKGELYRNGKPQTVAIKTLKHGATKQDRDDFISEAAILGQFSDPNVILLEGVIVEDQPNAIILEFMLHGALDKYLQENDMQFEIPELLEMARGIASGMKYLSELGFIHRDLAARNILVNEKRECKIADFGMSLEIRMDDGAEAKGGKIPVRWTAPEAIQFKKFTTASDVWSYGVVLWEIMSYGERPYWGWSNYEVLEQVNRGYRLPPPMRCPRVVHDLMLHCWNKDRTKRPLFSIIRDRIDAWLDNTRLLEDLAPIMKLDDNLDYTIMQTINKWLQAIGMGRYAANFLEQGFATPRQILLLTIDDLEKLGVGPVEHQKRIFKAIENTRHQVEARMGRTGSVISNGHAKDIKPHDL